LCKHTALHPIQLLASACGSLLHPRHFQQRAKLQNRIYSMQKLSGRRLSQQTPHRHKGTAF
jgi:hypothetical protein